VLRNLAQTLGRNGRSMQLTYPFAQSLRPQTSDIRGKPGYAALRAAKQGEYVRLFG
jgi:hypothetical protein